MAKLSYREYRMRLQWLRNQWNKPDRSDHYAMQVAKEVRCLREKSKKSILKMALDIFKIPFGWGDNEEKQTKHTMTVEEATSIAKSAWMSRLGASKPGKIRRQ